MLGSELRVPQGKQHLTLRKSNMLTTDEVHPSKEGLIDSRTPGEPTKRKTHHWKANSDKKAVTPLLSEPLRMRSGLTVDRCVAPSLRGTSRED